MTSEMLSKIKDEAIGGFGMKREKFTRIA